MIEFARVSVGIGGGVACAACGPSETAVYARAEEISQRIVRVVESWTRPVGPNIALVGPEPFMMGDLSRIVGRAVSAGVERLSVSTDAAALADRDTATRAISAGIRHIEVPLLAGSPETHDKLSGEPGSFAATLGGVEMYSRVAKEMRVPVLICGRIDVCGHNVKGLPQALHVFADTDANSVHLVIDPGVPTPVVRPWVDAAIETGIINGTWVSLEGHTAAQLKVHPLHDKNPAPVVDLADGVAT